MTTPIAQEEIDKLLDLVLAALDANQQNIPADDYVILITEWLRHNSPERYSKLFPA